MKLAADSGEEAQTQAMEVVAAYTQAFNQMGFIETEERDYYTLVTMGMGAHRMKVPEEPGEYKLGRAELAIALPGNWKLKHEDLKNERWYWPIRLLKTLARLPIASDTWLGFGHTMDNEEDFAKDTKLCAAILAGRQDTEDGGEVCILPGGEEVNFYQVIPLYREELDGQLVGPMFNKIGRAFASYYYGEPDKVAEYRKKVLSAFIKDGKAVLEELIGQRKEEAEDDDVDWDEEILGEMEGGYDNDRFCCYWDSKTGMTYPLILAKIPVRNSWEIFAWLPFGNWNECPDTPELMAAAKYWFEQYSAVPAAMSHDELKFELPSPVSRESALETAIEQYGFCPDIVDQEPENATVGALADVLRQSTVWYFWWD